MEASSFSDRLFRYAEFKGLNDNQITVKAKLSNGLIGKARNGKKTLSVANIEKLLYAFPDLSPEWLLTGRGEMLLEDKSENWSPTPCIETNPQETRPRIPLDAAAGSLSTIAQSVAESQCERLPIISRFPQYDFTIIVKGDSMEPEFRSGDEIACRFIDEPSFIQWGRPHILDTNQGVVLKRIYNRSNAILCRSDNNFYEDFEIPKEDIFHIALVVGAVRLF